ncbi:MAG: LacI family DNA-binding transcriptional regulator [Blautia sp.]|nr:LacI family DNA-binding transcriptional regulator [Blautia sp.]
MQSRVTIKDLAEKAGTSVASVHRALYGAEGVSDQLRKKILEEARRCNYRIDETASLLRRNAINITVLLPKATGNERFYYTGLWHGIQKGAEKLRKLKANVNLIETDYGINEMAEALENLYDETDISGTPIDGLVTICDDEKSRNWIERFIRKGTRVALVDRGLPIGGLSCSVETSVIDMGKLALELALLYGQMEDGPIILVNGHMKRNSYQAYARAVRNKQAVLQRQSREIVEIWTDSEEQVRRELKEKLSENRPSAVIAASARTTFWVCQEIRDYYAADESCPAVIGTDVFAEQAPFFESGVLRAVIYQSHITSGEKCLDELINSLMSFEKKEETHILLPLSVVLKDNYKCFLP